LHFLEVKGVWDQGGELRTSLYNNYKGEMAHMSSEGNHMLDPLFLQIELEGFLTEHNLNRTDVATKFLTGKYNNGEIRLYH
jgi:hypothetical protein